MPKTLIEGRGIAEDLYDLYKGVAGARQRYKGEMHVDGYNYLGPGSRLDIRLDGDTPRKGEEPINDLDRVALSHDVAYRQAGKAFDQTRNKPAFIQSIRKADNEFISKAKQSRDAPATGVIASNIISKKQYLETIGLLPTKTFSGRGVTGSRLPKYVSLALKKQKHKPEPT